eukprot:Platyproteum_vivax@DN7496_c0_g1_i10.p1
MLARLFLFLLLGETGDGDSGIVNRSMAVANESKSCISFSGDSSFAIVSSTGNLAGGSTKLSSIMMAATTVGSLGEVDLLAFRSVYKTQAFQLEQHEEAVLRIHVWAT